MCSPLCCLYLLTKLRSVLDWTVFYLRIYEHKLLVDTNNDEYDLDDGY
jgi:hypothetical protein